MRTAPSTARSWSRARAATYAPKEYPTSRCGPGVRLREKVQGRDHVLHLLQALAVGPGAPSHSPEVEAQGGPAPVLKSPHRGPDHVVVHAAAEQGVGMGDDHSAARGSRQKPAFQGDIRALDENLFFHGIPVSFQLVSHQQKPKIEKSQSIISIGKPCFTFSSQEQPGAAVPHSMPEAAGDGRPTSIFAGWGRVSGRMVSGPSAPSHLLEYLPPGPRTS